MARNSGDRTCVRNINISYANVDNTQAHNEREKKSYVNQDIVPERTSLNVHFKAPTDDYTKLFSHMEEEKIISTRGLKPDATKFCELVFDVNSAYFYNHGGYEYARQFYEEAYRAAIEIVGGEQYILSAVMHADERNRAMSEALGEDVYHYHLHVVYIPVVEKEILWSKRCKDPALRGTVKDVIIQVSRSKKWASKPMLDEAGEPMLNGNGKPILKKSYSVLQDDFYRHMVEAGYTDIERGEHGSTEEHLTVTQFKVQKEQERLVALEGRQVEVLNEIDLLDERKNAAENEAGAAIAEAKEARGRMNELAPILKNIEDFARKYSDDVDTVLPAAGTLETAKSYRKKVKPIFEKIIVVLRGLFHKYLNLQNVLERQERNIQYLQQKNAAMDASVDRLIEEKAELQGYKDDYDALCRGYGADTIAEKVRKIREQEQRERELRRASRRHTVRNAR